MEIDENLKRNELSPAERSMHMAERKRLYEEMYPETKKGQFNQHTAANRKVCDEQPERFTADTARKTGVSERKVQMDVSRGEKIQSIAKVVEKAQKAFTKASERIQAAAVAADAEKVLPSDGSVHPGNAVQFGHLSQRERAASKGVGRQTQIKLDALARRAPDLLDRVRAEALQLLRAEIPDWDSRVSLEKTRQTGKAAPALAQHGGERTKADEQGDIGTLNRGSNSATYLAARIKRDAPEIAAEGQVAAPFDFAVLRKDGASEGLILLGFR